MSAPATALHDGDLLVRAWRADDAAALTDAVADSDAHLRPWLPWMRDEPVDLAQRTTNLRWRAAAFHAEEDFAYGFWIAGRLVGAGGLHPRIGAGGLEIGYWTRAGETGRGIATRAARLLTGAGLSADGIDRVEIGHDERNLASGRIPPRLGYERVGVSPHPDPSGEGTVTQVRWRMTRARWRS